MYCSLLPCIWIHYLDDLDFVIIAHYIEHQYLLLPKNLYSEFQQNYLRIAPLCASSVLPCIMVEYQWYNLPPSNSCLTKVFFFQTNSNFLASKKNKVFAALSIGNIRNFFRNFWIMIFNFFSTPYLIWISNCLIWSSTGYSLL